MFDLASDLPSRLADKNCRAVGTPLERSWLRSYWKSDHREGVWRMLDALS